MCCTARPKRKKKKKKKQSHGSLGFVGGSWVIWGSLAQRACSLLPGGVKKSHHHHLLLSSFPEPTAPLSNCSAHLTDARRSPPPACRASPSLPSLLKPPDNQMLPLLPAPPPNPPGPAFLTCVPPVPPRAPLESQPRFPLPSSVRAGGLVRKLPLPPSLGPSSDNRPSSPNLPSCLPSPGRLLNLLRVLPQFCRLLQLPAHMFLSFSHHISAEHVVHVVSTSLSHGALASCPHDSGDLLSTARAPLQAWPLSGTCHHCTSPVETCFSPWLPRFSSL